MSTKRKNVAQQSDSSKKSKSDNKITINVINANELDEGTPIELDKKTTLEDFKNQALQLKKITVSPIHELHFFRVPRVTPDEDIEDEDEGEELHSLDLRHVECGNVLQDKDTVEFVINMKQEWKEKEPWERIIDPSWNQAERSKLIQPQVQHPEAFYKIDKYGSTSESDHWLCSYLYVPRCHPTDYHIIESKKIEGSKITQDPKLVGIPIFFQRADYSDKITFYGAISSFKVVTEDEIAQRQANNQNEESDDEIDDDDDDFDQPGLYITVYLEELLTQSREPDCTIRTDLISWLAPIDINPGVNIQERTVDVSARNEFLQTVGYASVKNRAPVASICSFTLNSEGVELPLEAQFQPEPAKEAKKPNPQKIVFDFSANNTQGIVFNYPGALNTTPSTNNNTDQKTEPSKKFKIFYEGEIELKTPALYAADPANDQEGIAIFHDLKPGTYKCYSIQSRDDLKVIELMIFHADWWNKNVKLHNGVYQPSLLDLDWKDAEHLETETGIAGFIAEDGFRKLALEEDKKIFEAAKQEFDTTPRFVASTFGAFALMDDSYNEPSWWLDKLMWELENVGRQLCVTFQKNAFVGNCSPGDHPMYAIHEKKQCVALRVQFMDENDPFLDEDNVVDLTFDDEDE